MALLTASHDKLFGYLMSLLGRWHDVQDVLQSSSLLMWRKFETYESGSNFVAWASTICFYEAKNFQRLAARSMSRSRLRRFIANSQRGIDLVEDEDDLAAAAW